MIDNPKKIPRLLRKKKTLSQEIKRGYLYLIFTIVGLNILLGGLLLAVGSSSNAKGYTLTELQRQADKLQTENKLLDKKITEAQAFINIEQETKEMTPKAEDEEKTSYIKKKSGISVK